MTETKQKVLIKLSEFNEKQYNADRWNRMSDCRNGMLNCNECKYLKGSLEYRTLKDGSSEYVVTHDCRLKDPWKCHKSRNLDEYRFNEDFWIKLQQDA